MAHGSDDMCLGGFEVDGSAGGAGTIAEPRPSPPSAERRSRAFALLNELQFSVCEPFLDHDRCCEVKKPILHSARFGRKGEDFVVLIPDAVQTAFEMEAPCHNIALLDSNSMVRLPASAKSACWMGGSGVHQR